MRTSPQRFVSQVRGALLLVCLMGGSHFTWAGDWAHWRGPSRNGHVDEAAGAGRLPTTPAWIAQVGEGSSSPLVIGDHVYTLGWSDGRDVLTCLDLFTGKSQWESSFPSPRHARFAAGDEGLYAGPTATPEYDSERQHLYVLSSDGWLRALDIRQRGKEIWGLNLYDRFGVGQRPKVRRSGLRDYGYTTSPRVYNDWLLVEVGAKQGLVMAFDKLTGKPIWNSEHAEPAGHTGAPVTIMVGTAPCLAVLAHKNLVVMHLGGERPGRTIATYAWETDWANNILTPTVREDSVLISAYHTHHAICRLRVRPDAIEEVWKQPYASHVGSPVIDGDDVYFCGKELYCLDWHSGQLRWSGGAFADGGSVVKTSDDRLLVLGSNGALALVESARRSPKVYALLDEKARLFKTDAWPHVVLARGRLLCKDRAGNLKCFAIAPP